MPEKYDIASKGKENGATEGNRTKSVQMYAEVCKSLKRVKKRKKNGAKCEKGVQYE